MHTFHIFERDGFSFEYKIEGEGRPLLILGSARYYHRLFPQSLTKHFQLIFFDQRAFAKTTVPLDAKQFRLSKLIDDIEAFRKFMKIKTWAVFGHSGHGYLALSYAKHYSQCVSQLLLCALSPDLSTTTFQQAENFWLRDAETERKVFFNQQIKLLESDLTKFPNEKMKYICHRTSAKRWYDMKVNELDFWEGSHCSNIAFDALWCGEFTNPTWFEGDEQFLMPTLLILGRYDYSYPPKDCWNPVSNRFQSLKIRVMEKSGHSPFVEEPGVFQDLLLRWLVSVELDKCV